MEAGTAAATAPRYMIGLSKAQRRKKEIAQFKRDIRAGRLTASAALSDDRASGAVTIGAILTAQRGWGERTAITFLANVGAPEAVLMKRVETLTDRQRRILVCALQEPFALTPRGERW